MSTIAFPCRKDTTFKRIIRISLTFDYNNEQGTPNGRIGTDVYVPMLKADYGGEIYWEANLLKGYLDADNTFRVSSDGKNFVQAKLTTDVNITPGYVHKIKINVGEAKQVEGNISDNDTYIVSGTREEPVNITGGNPTIYLKDANINVSDGPAINITSGNPTIHVFGGSNSITSSNGAGIYVAGSSTVTITGRSRDDALTTRGGNGGSGIGGNHATCGNIEISNMTVYAHGSDENGDFLSAGIGGSGDNGCGTITIDNATISAYGASDGAAGNMSSPGIGDKGTYSTITIKNNSQVSVQRGSNRSDYIGSGGSTNNPANSPNGIDATVDETSTITPLN